MPPGVYPRRSAVERFSDKWIPEPNTGCWLWLTATTYGYGRFKCEGRQLLAHRFAWELQNGPVPPGMVLDHVCRERSCVNPAHLRVVTPAQNVLENSVGLAARNARKTQCPRGHAYVTKRAGNYLVRTCRTCEADARARRKSQERAA